MSFFTLELGTEFDQCYLLYIYSVFRQYAASYGQPTYIEL